MTSARLDELDACLSRMQQIAQNARDGESSAAVLEFGIGDRWEEWANRIGELLDRLMKSVVHFAWVESPAAVTVVSWSGDVACVWAPSPAESACASHWNALASALKFRSKFILTIAAAVQTTAAIAAASASPLTVVAAVGSARRLVIELRELEALVNR